VSKITCTFCFITPECRAATRFSAQENSAQRSLHGSAKVRDRGPRELGRLVYRLTYLQSSRHNPASMLFWDPTAMAPALQTRVVLIVQNILRAESADTPSWLIRPGRVECRSEWDRVSRVYTKLTALTLPDVMPPKESREVDAVLLQKGCLPRILEVDEKQHFNKFRAATLKRYDDALVAFDTKAWLAASLAKKKLEGGGFAEAKPRFFRNRMADTVNAHFVTRFAT
jgi:hypothetical protein